MSIWRQSEIVLSVCYTSLSDWSKKLDPLSQPIGCKNEKTNRDLITRVFAQRNQYQQALVIGASARALPRLRESTTPWATQTSPQLVCALSAEEKRASCSAKNEACSQAGLNTSFHRLFYSHRMRDASVLESSSLTAIQFKLNRDKWYMGHM